MQTIQILALGKCKESYLRDACREYEKRLSRFCQLQVTELEPVSLPQNPSEKEIAAALEKEGYGRCPVCIAKTQYSMSDDPARLGAPEGYELTVRSVRLSAGAGFVVAFAGSIIAMPGLPKAPAALNIDVDDNGQIVGLF